MLLRKTFLTGFWILACLIPSLTTAKPSIQTPAVKAFIQKMVKKHQFNPKKLTALFSTLKSNPSIIQKITNPAEKWDWARYQKHFITQKRIQGGIQFWRKYQIPLKKAQQEFGIPPEIIVAIIGVESRYGQNKGQFKVLDALFTLAFDYPKRATFFKKELEQFLLLTREEHLNPKEIYGSYAGAMGFPQFISSSYRAYAIDFSKSGQKDLIHNPINAIGSVANYFKQHGWQPRLPIATKAIVADPNTLPQTVDPKHPKPNQTLQTLQTLNIKANNKRLALKTPLAFLALQGKKGPEFWLGTQNFYVITRYNFSTNYAMAIYQLSQKIKQGYQRQS